MQQYTVTLPAFPRGFHIITKYILNAIPSMPSIGLVNIFIQHTSAGLSINEAADPTVLTDFENSFNQFIPENQTFYTHLDEGSDDMPAHIKSSIVGSSISIPISNHKFNLGTWQGIYLCEFRNYGGPRSLVITVF
ncbi:MAG: secondary thiamine-phosphate synthase [Flavobacteriales bacterium]|nr:secondary thiamine-phosphate synthase [Flavobacteriales bacterium]|tara:strand:+ start:16773 stop:17177 length:405 start_codon:yes stop_codon:yes gene_type:complete